MKNIVDNIKGWDTKKKLVFITLAVVAISAVILLITWAQAPTYQVLYTNLQSQDAGAIVAKLQEMKIPYKTNATSILVPAEKVYDLRLQLASMGLPRGGGVGFEIFDKVGFGTTEFVQKINLKRALQGELARTIRSLQEVQDCRVHLSIPERSIFVTEQEPASASVLLKLYPGVRLSKKQIVGITHLVASAVEGLEPENVTVIDDRGNVLTTKEDEVAMLTTSQLEYQRAVEKDLEKRVINILEPVVGKGKVRAKARVNIDFTKVEETKEVFDPDGQVVRSEQKLVEQKNTPSPQGVPGVQSNLPGQSTTRAGVSSSGSVKQTQTINYEISKVVSHVVSPVGQIKRLSIAVLVDGKYIKDKSGKEKYVPRSEEEIANYEELIKKAVGFSEDRGDEIKVLNMPFKIENEELPAPQGRSYSQYIIPAARYGTILILSILAFFFIIRPLLSYLKAQPKRMPTTETPQTAVAAQELEGAKPVKRLPPADEVVEWARNNPQVAANIIRKWMEED